MTSRKQLVLLLAVFAAAAGTRAYLSPFYGGFDILALGKFSELLADVGPRDYYLEDFQHYLPGYLYVLWGLGELNEAFPRNLANITDFFILSRDVSDQIYFQVILKLPANVFDFATAVLIYKIIAKRISVKIAILGAALYLFNPAIFYNSAVWGQFDAVPTFFLLGAVYFLLERKPELAAVLFGIALVIKTQAISLLPVLALVFVLRTPPKRILLSAGLGTAVVFIIQLPFFWSDPVFGLISLIQDQLDYYFFDSLNAYNLWWIIGGGAKRRHPGDGSAGI